ncbi:hypothetical protein Q3G72_018363 [Acer saccharum]|nr:hypothetical protein Q3G72_018363 [Acer saccharum]
MDETIKLWLASSLEDELHEGDSNDLLSTVAATPTQTSPWIDPASLNLKRWIGRGPFGDVWLATQSGDDFDEYHEVVVKMLLPLKEDCTQNFFDKFVEVFLKCREFQYVCWLHGISVIFGRICVTMKFYEESVSDRIAGLKGGKLPLPNILRYGIELAKGILELHSIGLLVLNLNPFNLLINDHDRLIIGDPLIPYLLLGISFADSEVALRLGTPNYMAPEQWEPKVRGPVSIETDTWGFGCIIVEMLTSIQPWFGKSVEEIYHSVVIKQEKPYIPSGLPPAVENVINGCFEYDFRNRPLMKDILQAFERSLNAVYSGGEWTGLGSRALTERSNVTGYSAWYLLKDHLQVGDIVRSRNPLNARRPPTLDDPRGSVVGLDSYSNRSGFVRVNVPGEQNPVIVQESALERVTYDLAAGDWVSLKDANTNHSSVGILHSVKRDGSLEVGFIGLETLWKGQFYEVQMAKPYYIGQFVRLKANVFTPRFEWPKKRGGGWATGRILQVLPNGCLVVGFPGRLVFGNESNSFLSDPAEVEVVSFNTCPGMVEKLQHIEDYHWSVKPVAIALGLFIAVKLGLSVGRNVSAMLHNRQSNSMQEGMLHNRQGNSMQEGM